MRHFAILFTALLPLSFAAYAQQAPANKTTDTPVVEKTADGKLVSPLIKEAPLKTDHVLGKKDAPIVIVEYASLSCPHCAHFHSDILPHLEKKYIDTGKVRFVFRSYPLNAPALKGSMLVDCVGEKSSDRYYTFARVLFNAQSKWAFDGNYMSGLETFAKVGGVSSEEFQACLKDKAREDKLLAQQKEAAETLGVDHTPFFFIAGETYEDKVTVEAMSKFIDAKLAALKK